MVMHQMKTLGKGASKIFARSSRCPWLLVMGLLVTCVCTPSFGGLSQPGMVLTGTIYDTSGNLLTHGTLSVQFTPASTGPVVTREAALGELMGPSGVLSYAILIPLETAAPGSAVSSNALSISTPPVAYTRTIRVAATSISRTDSVSVSTADVGTVSRVDLPDYVPNGEFHSGDANQDHRFSMLELMREIELFTSTPAHAYHCDAAGEDGFGISDGEINCAHHSGDIDSNWKFSLSELLRMLELYSSTGRHDYCIDASGPDGFRPGLCGSKAESIGKATKAAARSSSGDSNVSAEDLAVQQYTAPVPTGESIDITVTFGSDADGQVASMGLEERLTPGWFFSGIQGRDAPAVIPAQGTSGLLEFAWLAPLANGGRFTFRVTSTAGAVSKTPFAVSGDALYRIRDVFDVVRIPIANVPGNEDHIFEKSTGALGRISKSNALSADSSGLDASAEEADEMASVPVVHEIAALGVLIAAMCLLALAGIRRDAA